MLRSLITLPSPHLPASMGDYGDVGRRISVALYILSKLSRTLPALEDSVGVEHYNALPLKQEWVTQKLLILAPLYQIVVVGLTSHPLFADGFWMSPFQFAQHDIGHGSVLRGYSSNVALTPEIAWAILQELLSQISQTHTQVLSSDQYSDPPSHRVASFSQAVSLSFQRHQRNLLRSLATDVWNMVDRQELSGLFDRVHERRSPVRKDFTKS